MIALVIIAFVQCAQGDLLYWNRMYNSLKEQSGLIEILLDLSSVISIRRRKSNPSAQAGANRHTPVCQMMRHFMQQNQQNRKNYQLQMIKRGCV